MLLILTTSISFSQDYESLFGTESTQWNMTIGNLWGIGTTEHQESGDTIIDNNSYMIINGYAGFEEIKGYLKQDSLNEKAWYRNNQMQEEILVMDLSLEVGDSLFIQGVWNSDHRHYFVDSVYTKNERKHIQFDLTVNIPFISYTEKFTLIEGVVSNMGFRYQDNDFINGLPSILLCAFKNEDKIYGEGQCVISSTQDSHIAEHISIYPNPVVDNINLKISTSIPNGQIEIINAQGKVVYSKSGSFSVAENIDLSEVSEGIYFIVLRDYDLKTVQTKKIIKVPSSR